MESARSPYLKHIFVCVNRRDPGVACCALGGSAEAQASGHVGSEAIREKLKAFVKANGLKGKVRVSSSGCMDLCARGPNVMVYPDHRWYSHVSLEDVDRIIEEHLAPLVSAVTPANAGVDSRWSLPPTTIGGGNDIEALLFDLGNVLVQFDHMAAAKEIAAHMQVTPEEFYRFIFESPLVVGHDEGRISTREFYDGLKRQVGLEVAYDRFLQVWNNIFTENREVTSLVKRLLGRYPCYLISNTNRPHFEFLRKRCAILDEMNGWILSYEVGHLKPHPTIYQRALEMIRLPASQIFYVDDRADLIEAGKGIGFQVHRFTELKSLVGDLERRGIDGLGGQQA